ncbi:reverse transcriptase domain-containing protein [Mesorhizobium sp. L103C105A0]|uniref:reverse transcriptase domain-containing protein n=1 Tax=Mesorhizobium sp. L103C105A0 TaxID=1287074 RepID=UPI00041F5FDE|nr:reverse transcriptase domain-containing protein [Mesorhizobium sp. L103C105A0]
MEDAIRRAIEFQSKKLLKKEERSRFADRKYQRKHKLRTGTPGQTGVYREPRIWGVAPHFNPKYCLAHSKFLARVIWLKIRERTYQPQPAVRYKIAKDSGGFREIMVFAIPDAAIANLFYRKLRDKNRNLFSPFSYAYMKDRGLFDAVIQLNSYLTGSTKYIIQFDFAKYFDSIDHKYIEHLFSVLNFNISDTEKYVLRAFLQHPIHDAKHYAAGPPEIRQIGVPQGSSLSLFLANLAGHELDRRLEATNGQFVRFADDIVAVTNNHDDALKILKAFEEHCRYSGITINHQKSPGISLMSSDIRSERRSFFVNDGDGDDIMILSDFDCIGHKFSNNKVEISTRGFKRTKRRISKILYIHLLYSLKSLGTMDVSRVIGKHFDWDLVTCVNEIRKFIYGGLPKVSLPDSLVAIANWERCGGSLAFVRLWIQSSGSKNLMVGLLML